MSIEKISYKSFLGASLPNTKDYSKKIDEIIAAINSLQLTSTPASDFTILNNVLYPSTLATENEILKQATALAIAL